MIVNRVDIETMIQRHVEAEVAVLNGKTIRFNGQKVTMENLSEIRKGRQEWGRRLSSLVSHRRGRPGYRLARFE